jgi:ATP-binding cassette subfamily C protein
MRLFLTLFREYPRRSSVVLLCLVLSVFADGIGISTWLPLITLLMGDGTAAKAPNQFEERVVGALNGLGLEPTLGVLLSIMLFAAILKGALNLLSKRQVGYSVAQVATDLRISLLQALMVTRWSYYTRQPIGVITAAFSSEADRGSKAYLYSTTIITQLMQTLLYASVALAVSWQATLGAAVAGAIITTSLGSLVRMTRRAGVKQTRVMRRTMGRLTDSLQALKALKAMAREQLVGPLLEKDTGRLNDSLRRIVLGKEMLRAIQEPIMVSFLVLGVYTTVGVMKMPFSEIIVLAVLFQRTLAAIGKAQRQYQSMTAQEPAYWAIREMLDGAAAEAEPALGECEPSLSRSITLRGVDFSYEDDRKVLDGVSLEIPAGQITGLVGASGGGKTTVTDLVVGLVRPDAGEVYIDDQPMAEVDIREWRKRIGYVPQEMFLLNESVARNVTLADPEISTEQVQRALERAGAAEFVAKLPEGAESSVGERGSLLSGGQRQRISIARALVHDPQLLLLDEATAALDPDTEKALWNSLVRLKGEVTILAISHQPGLFAAADRIYRLQDGAAQQIPAAEAQAALTLA